MVAGGGDGRGFSTLRRGGGTVPTDDEEDECDSVSGGGGQKLGGPWLERRGRVGALLA